MDAVYRRTKALLSLETFIERLTACGLMDAEEMEAFVEQLPSEQHPMTASSWPRTLFRSGKLTKFQAQAIYQGKTRGLVVGNYVVLDKLGKGGHGAGLQGPAPA